MVGTEGGGGQECGEGGVAGQRVCGSYPHVAVMACNSASLFIDVQVTCHLTLSLVQAYLLVNHYSNGEGALATQCLPSAAA